MDEDTVVRAVSVIHSMQIGDRGSRDRWIDWLLGQILTKLTQEIFTHRLKTGIYLHGYRY
jgi:hypothetical protein